MTVINFRAIEANLATLKSSFRQGVFEFCIIDDFLHYEKAKLLLNEIPHPKVSNIGKSRDYIFAKNKYEKSNISSLGPTMAALKQDLLSAEFQDFLSKLTGENVFVDPAFHGGGLHQGGEGSFLDMHVDFNYHPLNTTWFRNLNILIYLNEGWQKSFGGELRLKNKFSLDEDKVDPLFNRCVVMFTRDYTLHGYDVINFPEDTFRISVAAYAYSIDNAEGKAVRSTTWYVEGDNFFKKIIGLSWPKLVYIKSVIFGSGTKKNK